MKRSLLIIMATVLCFWSSHAAAFWWSDTPDKISGLDVTAGFDVNTVTTAVGTVLSLPERTDQEQHTVMTVATPQGVVTVVLGPWWYWEKQAITVAKNQDVTVTGSVAQGKDGVLYLFAQQLENRSTSETVTLRSETGKPLWSRSGASNQSGTRQQSGNSQRSGAGNRGNGTRGGRR